MAFSEVKEKRIENVNEASLFSGEEIYTALTSNDDGVYGAYFQMEERDDKYLIVVKNEGDTAEIKVPASDGIQGVNDLVLTLKKGESALLNIESGRFKRVSDNYGYCDNSKELSHGVSALSEKGKVFFIGKENVSIAVISLPV